MKAEVKIILTRKIQNGRKLHMNYNSGTAPEILSFDHKWIVTDLQVTGKQRSSFGFGQHRDLLEGQEVMDVDVVLCRRN